MLTTAGEGISECYSLLILSLTARRVGESGQVKTVESSSFDEAKKEFEKKFKSKSGLEWEDRMGRPKPNKYTFVEKSYAGDDDDEDADGDKGSTIESELEVPVQRLIELIFK